MMSSKLLLSLALLGVSIASAKTYHVTLAEPYAVGSQSLTAGDYHVVVSGTSAVLTGPRSEHIKINGNVENENQKFARTAVLSREETGKPKLEAIQIGGTHMEVNFN